MLVSAANSEARLIFDTSFLVLAPVTAVRVENCGECHVEAEFTIRC